MAIKNFMITEIISAAQCCQFSTALKMNVEYGQSRCLFLFPTNSSDLILPKSMADFRRCDIISQSGTQKQRSSSQLNEFNKG